MRYPILMKKLLSMAAGFYYLHIYVQILSYSYYDISSSFSAVFMISLIELLILIVSCNAKRSAIQATMYIHIPYMGHFDLICKICFTFENDSIHTQ